ncbi:MAG: M55 family metallopeptidase [Promethearchaeota archaeon]
MNVFVLTDLEGVSGVTGFHQTREPGPAKLEAMHLLTGEVNAVIRGIREHDPGHSIHVWDGHGNGGIVVEELLPVEAFLPPERLHMADYFQDAAVDALAFVGQHAMSYTPGGNLCHTMSSRNVEYYSLNGELVGEFGIRAAIAGELGVPVTFLSGDDKACEEARRLVPGIVTVEVKRGTGWESADSLPVPVVHDLLREGIGKALAKVGDIPPVLVDHPVTLEIASRSWFHALNHFRKGAKRSGTRTAVFEASDMRALVDRGVL